VSVEHNKFLGTQFLTFKSYKVWEMKMNHPYHVMSLTMSSR